MYIASFSLYDGYFQDDFQSLLDNLNASHDNSTTNSVCASGSDEEGKIEVANKDLAIDVAVPQKSKRNRQRSVHNGTIVGRR